MQVLRKRGGAPHRALRPYHSSAARYGHQGQQLDCEFCMAVKAGRRVILRGQTGIGLDEVMRRRGDAKAQAEQAMDNVETLLADAGASIARRGQGDRLCDGSRVPRPASTRSCCAVSPASTPAFTAVIVKGLASPELLMEVDITAIPERRR